MTTVQAANPGAWVEPTGAPALEFLEAIATPQSTNIGAGDHLKYDMVVASQGTSIVLDTTTPYTNANNVDSIGRVTLQPGTYLVTAILPFIAFSAAAGVFIAELEDADAGTILSAGNGLILLPTSFVGNSSGGPIAQAIVVIPATVRIELRFIVAGSILTIGGNPPNSNLRILKL